MDFSNYSSTFTDGGFLDPSVWKNQYDSSSSPVVPTTYTTSGSDPSTTIPYISSADTPELLKNYAAIQQINDAARPGRMQEAFQNAQLQAQLSRQEMADAFPMLSAASAQATARNLAASEKFASFKEGLPSNIQNIMASKQSQLSSASDAVYRRALGMSAQANAAKDFAKNYVGKMFAMS